MVAIIIMTVIIIILILHLQANIILSKNKENQDPKGLRNLLKAMQTTRYLSTSVFLLEHSIWSKNL